MNDRYDTALQVCEDTRELATFKDRATERDDEVHRETRHMT